MKLTPEEKGIVAITRLNKAWNKNEIRKAVKFGRHELEFHWRSKDNLWGRFGGGWNWILGVQVGSTTVIANCLVFSLSWRRR